MLSTRFPSPRNFPSGIAANFTRFFSFYLNLFRVFFFFFGGFFSFFFGVFFLFSANERKPARDMQIDLCGVGSQPTTSHLFSHINAFKTIELALFRCDWCWSPLLCGPHPIVKPWLEIFEGFFSLGFDDFYDSSSLIGALNVVSRTNWF